MGSDLENIVVFYLQNVHFPNPLLCLLGEGSETQELTRSWIKLTKADLVRFLSSSSVVCNRGKADRLPGAEGPRSAVTRSSASCRGDPGDRAELVTPSPWWETQCWARGPGTFQDCDSLRRCCRFLWSEGFENPFTLTCMV